MILAIQMLLKDLFLVNYYDQLKRKVANKQRNFSNYKVWSTFLARE
jgi:hypothetical protein